MSTAPAESSALTVTAAVDQMQAALDTVRGVLAPDLSDMELRLFAMVAQRSRLDPFARQIHAIKRSGKLTFQTGIDGFRSSAEDTAEYRGSDEPTFGPVADKPFPHPEWARVVVHRQYPNGEWLHQPATVHWDEFYPGAGQQDFMWKKMPRNQLAKCAEAAAFRKAFPKRFGDIYTPEEMAQADVPAVASTVAPTAKERIAERRAAVEAAAATDAAVEGEFVETTSGSAEPTEPAGASKVTGGVTPAVSVDGAPAPNLPSGEAGVSAGELRDWLRDHVIGITEALKLARTTFGDEVKTLDALTDGQRAALRDAFDK